MEQVFQPITEEQYKTLADDSFHKGLVGADVRQVIERAVETHIDELLTITENEPTNQIKAEIKVPYQTIYNTLATYQKHGKKLSKIGFNTK
jgi:hypothetical protein